MRVAVVGASGQVGARCAVALRALAPERPLLLVGRREAPLRSLAARLGGDVRLLAVDASRPEGAARICAEAGTIAFAAGPGGAVGIPLLAVAARAGLRWADAADEPALTRAARGLGPAFEAAGGAVTSATSAGWLVALDLRLAPLLPRAERRERLLHLGAGASRGAATRAQWLARVRGELRVGRPGREQLLPLGAPLEPAELPFGTRPRLRDEASEAVAEEERFAGLQAARAFDEGALLVGLTRRRRGWPTSFTGTFAGGPPPEGTDGGLLRLERRGEGASGPRRASISLWSADDGLALVALPLARAALALDAHGGWLPPSRLTGGLDEARAAGLRIDGPHLVEGA